MNNNLENNSVINGKNKAILFLINGLGIASKDSFSIDYADIMPNMSMLMGNYLYTTLENVSYNYRNGFRNLSLGNDLLPTYHKLDQDTNFSSNEAIVSLSNDLINSDSKLHVFCFLDNDTVINQTMKIVTYLTEKKKSSIFIHIILRQKDVIAYDDIALRIKKIEDAITLYPNIKIGTITGERTINSDLYFRLIMNENGERWPDYNRKINFSRQQEVIPRDLNPFYMNPGFRISDTDIALFLNYEDSDCNKFIDSIKNIKLYSLFPMKLHEYAFSIYEEIEPTNYFTKILEDNNLKCLVLTTEDRIPAINFNLNGLKDIKSNNLDYMLLDKNMDILTIIRSDYSYFIFDYDIESFQEVRKLKEFLRSLDEQIGMIYNLCDQEGYQLFISSLYGIYKNFIAGIDKEVKFDYSVEVPAIIVNKDIQRAKNTFKYGTTHDLSNTIFFLLTNNSNIPNSIRKKGILSFFKN